MSPALTLELPHRLRQLLVASSSRLIRVASPILLAFDAAVIALVVGGVLEGAEPRALMRAAAPAFVVIAILLALRRPIRRDR